MRRATLILGLLISSIAVAFATFVYGLGPLQSSSTVEPRRGETKGEAQQAQQGTEPNEPSGDMPLQSTDGYQSSAATEAFSAADEDTARKMLRQRVTREVGNRYSLLLNDLDLNPEDKESLISLLIDQRIATTTTMYKRGKPVNKYERKKNIAAIIGDAKLQNFLALERNLSAYSEVHQIASILQRYGVPLADSQRDQLVTILVEVRDQYKTPPASDVKRDSIEYLEYIVTQRDEFERHIMELAPSVLSAKQVQYLFEQYQQLAYERAAAMEQQEDRIAAGDDNDVLHYPVWESI